MKSNRRKRSKGKRNGQNKSGQQRTDLLEQPVADLIGNVPCEICGHPVDPKRMHFHMVRFHGAAFRSKRG